MKSWLLISLTCLMIGLASPLFGQKKAKKYLPKVVKKLTFDTSLEKATAKVPGLELIRDASFRSIYSWSVDAPELTSVVVYFDKENHQPLYEYILEYASAEQRDLVAQELLGEPNQPEEEWLFPTKEGYSIRAWTFKNKLVIVALLPDTEWEE